MSNIDTSTTAGKIAVMQAFEDGKQIQHHRTTENTVGWVSTGCPIWQWNEYFYRIKPQTVEEAAREYSKDAAWERNYKDGFIEGSVFGAQWKKEQDQ